MKLWPVFSVVLLSTSALAADGEWPIWNGWELMGAAGVFSYGADGGAKTLRVWATPNATGAALRKDARMPLSGDLELSWQWRVAQLPSTDAEDTEAKHHYFAVSVIFDNGKNLSYIWSSKLEKEYGFRCPLPEWKDKETHVVVETGSGGLGHVLSYRRNILADYARFIGGPVPMNVAKVWIVARTKGGDGPLRAQVLQLTLGSQARQRTSYL